MSEDVLQILLNHNERHGNKPASFLFKKKKTSSCKLNTAVAQNSLVVGWLSDQVFMFLEPKEEIKLSDIAGICCDASVTLLGSF